jgi:hypothetical protein
MKLKMRDYKDTPWKPFRGHDITGRAMLVRSSSNPHEGFNAIKGMFLGCVAVLAVAIVVYTVWILI